MPTGRPPGQAAIAGSDIGLRTPWFHELMRRRPPLGFVELLADNHLAPGGPARWQARALAERYPVTLHCVGMSLGSVDPIDRRYLRRVRRLADELQAVYVSDHIAFTRVNGVEYHDLLPLPGTEEALDHLCRRVDEAQDRLGRRLLLENPSRYLPDAAGAMPELEFLQALYRRTDCGLLLDLNNLYVSQHNVGGNALAVVEGLDVETVGYIHIAGHEPRGRLLVDSHGAPVSEPVWQLLDAWTRRAPGTPVLVERDNALPPLDVMLQEAQRARNIATSSQCHAA